MIDNLLLRQHHWDKPENRAPREDHDLADSVPYPFSGFEHLFVGRDVMEIGPGRGRQYVVLSSIAKSYAVCDISPTALEELVLADATHKLQLRDYGDDFAVRFDVIHFWYVLHHIRVSEMEDFFAFVARHLRQKGIAIFNSPQDGNPREWYTDDGIGTTWMDSNVVIGASQRSLSVVKCCRYDERSTGFVFVMEKV